MNRRRFLAVLAASPGLLITQRSGAATPRPGTRFVQWTGTALGADAAIRIAHADPVIARRLLGECLSEIRRLELAFSLYDPESELARLNRDGNLDRPSPEMLRIMASCAMLHRTTAGAFDPAVQPLWDLYMSHFMRRNAGSEGPSPDSLAQTLAFVGFGEITMTDDRIAFRKQGMAVTLNGIAQGYLTDRIAALLRRTGIRSALVETGETYALGKHPDGRTWRIGIAEPTVAALNRIVALADRAIATSSPSAAWFEPTGQFHHLFDPRTGRCADRYASVTVTAPNATLADGLSTAFTAMPLAAIAAYIAVADDVGAYVIGRDGAAHGFGRL